MWGYNKDNPTPPFMSITSYGKKVLANEDVIPHDPENFIKSFKENVPDADDVIIM